MSKTAAQNKRSLGEELFLVHLHRQTPEDAYADRDDPVLEGQRKRSRSVGEELYEVFLRRSEGTEPDYDLPATTSDAKKKATKPKKKTVGPAHVLHLRNRDVPPPTVQYDWVRIHATRDI